MPHHQQVGSCQVRSCGLPDRSWYRSPHRLHDVPQRATTCQTTTRDTRATAVTSTVRRVCQRNIGARYGRPISTTACSATAAVVEKVESVGRVVSAANEAKGESGKGVGGIDRVPSPARASRRRICSPKCSRWVTHDWLNEQVTEQVNLDGARYGSSLDKRFSPLQSRQPILCPNAHFARALSARS